jgi:hypothetical protein
MLRTLPLGALLFLAACGSHRETASPVPASVTTLTQAPLVEHAEPAVDPTSFVKAGHLHEARSLATATVLRDGRVLVAGGEDALERPLASVEIFDPKSNTWSLGPPLPAPRVHHTARLLENGELLIAGGGASAFVFDPKKDVWREVDAASADATRDEKITLPSGRSLFVSGREAAIVDGKAKKSIAPLAEARHGHALALLPDGSVLVIGGRDPSRAVLDLVERSH